MIAIELSPGNKIKRSVNGEILTVRGVSDRALLVREYDVDLAPKLYQVEGIDITPYILTNNGFKECPNFNGLQSYTYKGPFKLDFLRVEFFHNEFTGVYLFDEKTSAKHIHHLQNIHLGATGRELIINL